MGGKQSEPPHYLRAWRLMRGLSQDELADKAHIGRSAISKIEAGQKPLMESRLSAFAKALGVEISQLYEPPPEVDIHNHEDTKRAVAVSSRNSLALPLRGKRTGDKYKPLTDQAALIGRVQAGAWTEAYQLPEGEWEWMPYASDDRFPGIPQYFLENVGQSMNNVCRDGGRWVCVFYRDLVGQGPSAGQYVVVERERRDGLVEATVKLFKIGPDGQPWLHPDSSDPAFKPFPLVSEEPEVAEIRIVARAVDAINRL